MCVYGVPRITCGLSFCVYFLTCMYLFLNVFVDVGASVSECVCVCVCSKSSFSCFLLKILIYHR